MLRTHSPSTCLAKKSPPTVFSEGCATMLTAQGSSCHMLDRRKLCLTRTACARVCRGLSAVPLPSSAHPSVTPRRRLVARFRNGGDTSTQQAQKQQAVGGGTAVPVVFELCKHCAFGHTFALVGDAPELGEWDVTKALRLEWSEGDVWRGRAELALDAPVSFKYIQLDRSGGLVAWGQDIAGGSNISLMVAPSDDEVMGGLQLTMDPTDAADTSHQPYLVARLDSAALLPESAAPFEEAEALHLAAEEEQAAAAASAVTTPTEDEQTDDTWEDAVLGQVRSGSPGPSAAGAAMSAYQNGMVLDWGLADEPPAANDVNPQLFTAEHDAAAEAQMQQQQQQDGPADSEDGLFSNVGQLQLQDESASEKEQRDTEGDSEGWGSQLVEPAAASVAAVIAAAPETTSESVQDQGLQQMQDTTQGFTGAVGADVGGAGAAAREALGSPAAPLAAGGVAAGYGDDASVRAAVAAGLMEAGDDETTAGFTGPFDTPTPAPSAASSSSSSFRSHMIASMDQEDSDTDESTATDDVTNSVTSAGDDVTSGLSNSVIDSTPHELDREQLMAATAQESARLASSSQADSANSTSAAAAADDSRGSLEGLPTPADSNAAAVADKMLGAQVMPVADAQGCRPPNPHSKIIAAGPSYTTVDPDAPLQDISMPITEIDSSSKGFQPVDSYEGALGALTVLAAAAASFDGGEHHKADSDREGAAAAAEQRQMQLVRADEDSSGDGEGTGTWTGGAAAGGNAADSAEAHSSAAAGSAVDGERTGTWTGEAAAAAAAAGSDGSSSGTEGAQRATEVSQPAPTAAAQGDPSGRANGGGVKKKRNWLQRLFSGGGQEDDRA